MHIYNHYITALLVTGLVSYVIAFQPVFRDKCKVCQSNKAVLVFVAGHILSAAAVMTIVGSIHFHDTGCIGMLGPPRNGRVEDTYLVDKTCESQVLRFAVCRNVADSSYTDLACSLWYLPVLGILGIVIQIGGPRSIRL